MHTCEQDTMVRNNLITAYLDITSIDCSGVQILIKCGKTQLLGELPALTSSYRRQLVAYRSKKSKTLEEQTFGSRTNVD